uniref:thiolase family protein n=1 Tax=Microbacterium sp. CPCC 204701 TaxID=2493084 RepID=UPI0031582003
MTDEFHSSDRIVLVSGARTPIGTYGGVFHETDAYELGAQAVTAALSRGGVEAEDVDEVIMGCISQNGPDAYNAREFR